MPRFRKRPVPIEAHQWFKDGDHPDDGDGPEGKVVRHYRRAKECNQCERPRQEHGWIYAPEGGYRVCPGDWVITGYEGKKYPCKPDNCKKMYEIVDEDEEQA